MQSTVMALVGEKLKYGKSPEKTIDGIDFKMRNSIFFMNKEVMTRREKDHLLRRILLKSLD